MALELPGEVVGSTIPRLQFEGREIRGQIVEVLLPKGKEKGAKERLKQTIKVKAKTVCLQVGDGNRVVFAGLPTSANVPDALTKVSEEEEMVIRVLRGYGTSEELVPMNVKKIDIHSDFVRIVQPFFEKSNIQELTINADIEARLCAVNGNKSEFAISPEESPNVFDSTRPVLRVLRMPTKPIALVRSAKDFPNVDKDHLIVLEILENRFTTTATEYRFSERSSISKTKRMRDFYEVKISVSQCGKNGKTEIRDGVLFKREPSFDLFRGIIGFWCRFQSDKARYYVTFSLWKTKAASQTSELLDEVPIAFETTERKIPPRKVATKNQSQSSKPNSAKATSLPVRIRRKQTSLPERDHSSVTPSVESHATNEESRKAEEAISYPELGVFHERCLYIWKILLPLRDDGEWEEFDHQAELLLKEYAEDTDVQIAVILEQGMASCFRNELISAEKFIKKAIGMIPQASPTLLRLVKARASYYLASVYRRDAMTLGKAQKCVESAKKHLSDTAFTLDQACLAYEEGCVLFEYAHKPCVLEQAERSFDRCVELCSLDTDNLIFRYCDLAQIKKAMLLLECSTKSGRESRTIDEGTLIKAKQCLDKIKQTEDMTRIAQAQYHVVRSDQYFREGRNIDAKAHARVAFDLSQKFGFDIERTAKIRLDCYDGLL